MSEIEVKRLIERSRSSGVSLSDLAKVCPYRTLLAAREPLTPATTPTVVVAALGFVPEDFSDKMRTDIMAEIGRGGVVMLISNSRELRDYAKREIALMLTAARGAA